MQIDPIYRASAAWVLAGCCASTRSAGRWWGCRWRAVAVDAASPPAPDRRRDRRGPRNGYDRTCGHRAV